MPDGSYVLPFFDIQKTTYHRQVTAPHLAQTCAAAQFWGNRTVCMPRSARALHWLASSLWQLCSANTCKRQRASISELDMVFLALFAI